MAKVFHQSLISTLKRLSLLTGCMSIAYVNLMIIQYLMIIIIQCMHSKLHNIINQPNPMSHLKIVSTYIQMKLGIFNFQWLCFKQFSIYYLKVESTYILIMNYIFGFIGHQNFFSIGILLIGSDKIWQKFLICVTNVWACRVLSAWDVYTFWVALF